MDSKENDPDFWRLGSGGRERELLEMRNVVYSSQSGWDKNCVRCEPGKRPPRLEARSTATDTGGVNPGSVADQKRGPSPEGQDAIYHGQNCAERGFPTR